ncbi:MAG: PEP-CTERM sorting domain-containing protein [Desulfobacula sp.]|jgi:hypothetical protein
MGTKEYRTAIKFQFKKRPKKSTKKNFPTNNKEKENMKKILAALFVTLFLCSSASAYTIQFDRYGNGNFLAVEAWGLESNAESSDTPSGAPAPQDWWSYEDSTGFFTEALTVQLSNMDIGGLQTDTSDDAIYVDVYLEGTQNVADGFATFSYGTAIMYHDKDGNHGTPGADDDYDAGTDDPIAEFLLQVPAIMPLTGTVLDMNLAGDIDLVFAFTKTYADYFGDTEDQLAQTQWLLALMGGRISIADSMSDGQDGYIRGWDTTDIDTQFNAVPEPATMLLFGLGLIGLAGASRKRLS